MQSLLWQVDIFSINGEPIFLLGMQMEKINSVDFTILLRKSPGGDFTVFSVQEGDKIEVIKKEDGTPLTEGDWTRIRVVDSPVLASIDEEGWIRSGDIVEIEVPDQEQFILQKTLAHACVLVGRSKVVNASSLIAIAWAESNGDWEKENDIRERKIKITGDPEKGIGPFRFTQSTWDQLVDQHAKIEPIKKKDIKNPLRQCIFAAIQCQIASKIANETLGRKPTTLDFFLAHIIGPKFAGIYAETQNKNIDTFLRETFSENANAANGILERYGALAKEDSGEFRTLKGFLDAARVPLNKALDDIVTELLRLVPGIVDEEETPKDADAATRSAALGNLILITPTDADVLARVGQSEVSIFKNFGFDQLKGGLEAVVDTIINRVSHPSKEFPGSIEAVVNKKAQFSKVTEVGGWNNLPVANQEITNIVESYLVARTQGRSSAIKGATHFLNPKSSDQNNLEAWGNHVVANAIQVYGDRNSAFVHYHGFAPGTPKPDDYTLEFRGRLFAFSGDGTPIKAITADVAGDEADSGTVADGQPALSPSSFMSVSSINIPNTGDYDADFRTLIASLGLQYFSAQEFLKMGRQHNEPGGSASGLNQLPPRELWRNIIPTARVLEKLREKLGKSITTLSIYRSPAYNTAIGGVSNSQHKLFKAVDFTVTSTTSRPQDWADVLRDMRSQGLFTGAIGIYSSFVHIDTRNKNVNF